MIRTLMTEKRSSVVFAKAAVAQKTTLDRYFPITLATGRTTVLQGGVHMVILGAFLVIAAVP
jgi:hypothetical protein